MDSVVHFEIPADDPKRAQKFYKSAFGWKFNEVPKMDYHIIHTTEVDKKMMPTKAGAINGGMMKRSRPDEKQVIVINVASLDAAIKKIEKLGGKVVMSRMEVGDMGYYARVEDTEGNVIGVWQNRKKM